MVCEDSADAPGDSQGKPLAEQLAEQLRGFSLFEPLSAKEAEELVRAASAEREHYRKGEHIYGEQESADCLFLILRGVAAIQVKSITPAYDITLARLGPGETLGEMALAGMPARSTSARCVEEVETIRLESEPAREFLRERPELGMRVLERLALIGAERVRACNRRLLNMCRASLY